MKAWFGVVAALLMVSSCTKVHKITVGKKSAEPPAQVAPPTFRLLPGAQEGASTIIGKWTDRLDVLEAKAQREGRAACEAWARKLPVAEGLKLLGVDVEVLPAGVPPCEAGAACLGESVEVKCIQVVAPAT